MDDTFDADSRADGWTDGRMDGWPDGRMDGWMDGRTDGWTDRRTLARSLTRTHACTRARTHARTERWRGHARTHARTERWRGHVSSSARGKRGGRSRRWEGGRYGWKPSSSSNFSIRAFRAQICKFELFELILLSKLDKQIPVEQCEASRAIRGGSTSVSSTLPPSEGGAGDGAY